MEGAAVQRLCGLFRMRHFANTRHQSYAPINVKPEGGGGGRA